MIRTNLHGLPAPLVSAVLNDKYEHDGDISATGLIKPVRMRVLEKRHDAEIIEDVSERIYSLLGQSVAVMLERADTFNHLPEERMSIAIGGWKVSGRPDLLTPAMILQDYKVTSVFSFLLGEKAEWEQQLNIYALLYRRHGFDIQGLQIVAILRDWTKSRADREADYPQCGAFLKDIPLWSEAKQEAFVMSRARAHQVAELLADDDLPDCTPEERWQRPDSWAVKKPANKKAYRVFDNEAAALALAQEKEGMAVEFRPGASVRCASYCRVSQFCNWWQQNKPAAPVETDEAA